MEGVEHGSHHTQPPSLRFVDYNVGYHFRFKTFVTLSLPLSLSHTHTHTHTHTHSLTSTQALTRFFLLKNFFFYSSSRSSFDFFILFSQLLVVRWNPDFPPSKLMMFCFLSILSEGDCLSIRISHIVSGLLFSKSSLFILFCLPVFERPFDAL